MSKSYRGGTSVDSKAGQHNTFKQLSVAIFIQVYFLYTLYSLYAVVCIDETLSYKPLLWICYK
jgi:hypothetical protein